ncbi:MAG: SDR family oxidoreductase [Erysipelotrichaceae bacterium]|nr:SDR family oxidoreductase [Erysipelotrichaceae bacterium]
MELGLKNKVVIVTGGSKGVGAGISDIFAQEGATLVIDYRSDREYSENFAKELSEKYGVRAIAVQADVSREDQCDYLFEETLKAFGTVDCLINNAATWCKHYPIEEFKLEDYRYASSANVESVLMLSSRFIRICKQQKKPGHIVNVLTKSVFWSSSINNDIYVATKGAVAAVTRSLAHECAKDDIFVNAIIPGYSLNSSTDLESPRMKRVMGYIPNGKLATPFDMGYVTVFLCSDKAGQVNGAMIDCTGGTMNGHGDDAIRKSE